MLDRKIASLPVATNHELSTYLVPNGALAYENVASNLVAGRCLDFLLLFLRLGSFSLSRQWLAEIHQPHVPEFTHSQGSLRAEMKGRDRAERPR